MLFISYLYNHDFKYAHSLHSRPCKRKAECSNPSRDRPKSLKTGSDSSTTKRFAIGMRVAGPRR